MPSRSTSIPRCCIFLGQLISDYSPKIPTSHVGLSCSQGEFSCLSLSQARQIESDLEAKISAFAKFCSGYEGSYRGKGETGLAVDQVSPPKLFQVFQSLLFFKMGPDKSFALLMIACRQSCSWHIPKPLR